MKKLILVLSFLFIGASIDAYACPCNEGKEKCHCEKCQCDNSDKSEKCKCDDCKCEKCKCEQCNKGKEEGKKQCDCQNGSKKQCPSKKFEGMDKDEDGAVSMSEFKDHFEHKFAEMDKNEDGKISKEEMMEHHKAKKENCPHKGGEGSSEDKPIKTIHDVKSEETK